jgi:hypothetical protein
MRRRGMDGGAFWSWVSFTTSEDSDLSQPTPVKRRGAASVYNPVKDALVRCTGALETIGEKSRVRLEKLAAKCCTHPSRALSPEDGEHRHPSSDQWGKVDDERTQSH